MREKVKRLIKSELAKRGFSYADLALKMRKKGYEISENSIRTKLSRGTFSATFLFEVADALGAEIFFKAIDDKDQLG